MAEIIDDNDSASGPKVFEFRRAGKRTAAEERSEAIVQAERARFFAAQAKLPRVRLYTWLTGFAFGGIVASPAIAGLPWQGRMTLAAVCLIAVAIFAAFASIAVRETGLSDS